MREGEEVFQRLCHEAVQVCGPDIAAVERYVAERLATMDGAARSRVDAEIKRVLLFQGPLRPGGSPN